MAEIGKTENSNIHNDNPTNVSASKTEKNKIKKKDIPIWIQCKELEKLGARDATAIKKIEEYTINSDEGFKVPDLNKFFKIKNGQKDYKKEFKDYTPTDEKKYNKVLNYVRKEYQSQHSGKIDENETKIISNMVCSLSERYGVDPEIIAPMLGHETGGFVFEKRTMDPDKKPKIKGVMQVHIDMIETMYANPKDANNPKLSRHKRAIAYDNRHYRADASRIAELKTKYPTAKDLFNAIKKDVTLGLEVGIMAYKAKLSGQKGDTRKALRAYCGDQYRLPSDTTAVRKIWPLPVYKKA